MRFFLVLFVSLFISTNIYARKPLVLDNGNVAIEFYEAINSDGEKIAASKIYEYIDGKKMLLPSDSEAESYCVFDLSSMKISQDRFYSYWFEEGKEENKIRSLFEMPHTIKCMPRKAIKDGDKIILTFDEFEQGHLNVVWQLAGEAKYFDVSMHFIPSDTKKYSLGYKLFIEKEISQINNLLLPMMWQQKRFPEKSYTLFDNQTPTPVSIIDFSKNENRYSYAITASPETFKYEWPNQHKRNIGLLIRNEKGLVNPAICGPFDAGKGDGKLKLSFKVTVDSSDWYSSFRYICDNIYKLTDYRSNYKTNLTEAIYNMIDLIMDDDKGGWWPRAKGFYQIESLNGSSQGAPLTLLSLYYLTGDMEIYKRRALPTLEFVLSRSGFHFSPVPDNTGHYDKGKMVGPIRNYGTTVYGSAWEMTNRLMPVFKDIAFEERGINLTSGYTHAQEFEEWLLRYKLTGETKSLDKACQLADKYIADNIFKPAEKDLGIHPFFLIHFIPDWEGLLRMYEVTGKSKYLDAACYGANLLTTGIWTQPLISDRYTTIHKGDFFEGDIPGICMRKGAGEFRLGYDQDPVTPRNGTQKDPPKQKEVPSWLVSNVGLGFEQPLTVFHPLDENRKARLIYQTVWTPNFLRLAAYTDNKTYEKYARNAVLGRWANYPGYYATGFTDCPNDEKYPFVGPDISCIYYHHIPVHLGWAIDYLITDAYLVSKGKVNFPSQRQNGYAYFDMRVYGNKPGQAFGVKDLWLWFKKGLLSVSNPQVNYITAHTEKDLFVVFTNQSKKREKFTVSFDRKMVSRINGTLYIGGSRKPVKDMANTLELNIAPRDAVMLQVENPGIDFPYIHYTPKTGLDLDNTRYSQTQTVSNKIKLRGCSMQVVPDFWSGYLWLEAKFGDIKFAEFNYSFDGKNYKKFKDIDYPFEFSSEITKDFDEFHYFVEGIDSDGNKFKTNPEKVFRGR